MEHETFWTLIADRAHWEFELFLIFIFDVVIGLVLWPRLKKWKSHHKSDDAQIAEALQKISDLEKQVKSLQERLNALHHTG